MLYIVYAFVVTVVVAMLGSIIPMIQFFVEKRKVSNLENDSVKVVDFVFSRHLFDANFNPSPNNANIASRTLVGTRGWIRGPQGHILTDYEFKKKRSSEYKIELP